MPHVPRRRAIAAIAATLLVALTLTVPAASRADALSYACEPPSPAAPENCAVWHTSPVTLRWVIDPTATVDSGSDCAEHVISDDTAGTDFTCIVTPPSGSPLSQTATVRVDQTPPAVTVVVPDRRPDHDGWYNHPVAFTFAGTDATSGIADCDTLVYDGPDTATGQVTGACRDVAGNSGSGSVPLKYDATRPAITPILRASNDGEVNLQWSASPDAVQFEVERSPGDGGQSKTIVYTGSAPSFTDHDVVQQRTYTYTISASDAAANSSSLVVVARPGGSQRVVRVKQRALPLLRWPRVRNADYYNVQVYRGRRKILSAWPKHTRLQMRESWHYRGRTFRLMPGDYQWYVWPGFGSRREHRYGRLIAHRRFTVPAA
jgi:hypothetical protein